MTQPENDGAPAPTRRLRSADPARSGAAAPAVKARLTSFDVSRGIAIVLMVIGHSVSAVASTEVGVSEFWITANVVFHTVRMPLFFFLAGVFLVATLKKLGYAKWVVDKAQYLLYPWLVWTLLRGAIESVLYMAGIGGRMTIGEAVYGIVWDPRIWYLPALFLSFAVIGGGYAAARGWKWWPLVMLVALLGLIFLAYQPWWPPILRVHIFSVYMLAGVVLGPLAIMLAGASRRSAGLIALAATALFAATAWVLFPTGLLHDDGTIGFVACSVSGVVALLAVGRVIDGWPIGRILEHLGRWSLVIYVVHALPVSAVREVMMRVGLENDSALVLVPAVFGVAVPALLGWLNDRGHFRWLITMPGYRRRSNTRLP